MFKWAPYVMVRICLFFIAGIVFGIYQPELLSINNLSSLTLLTVFLYFISYFSLQEIRYRKLASGIIGLTALFFLGNLLVHQKTESRNLNHILHVKKSIHYYTGEVISSLDEKINSWKTLIEVDYVKTDSGWQKATGKVQLYISKKEGTPTINYGDQLIIKGYPEEIKPPANPGEFDFKRFLSFKNIYHQHFSKLENVKVIRHTTNKSLIAYSYKIRLWATAIIKKFVIGERERAISFALILGVTDGIDNDLLSAYSSSGAMHVLSVSGLHVGIIYFILLLFLKPLSSVAWSRWLLALLTFISLWAYAFITGLSPSVLRAVMMFSFIAIAKPLGWKTTIYNTLAASAFLLLLYNPYLVMSVGFQLSYIAVMGIVYLQRPIYNLWEPSSWLLDKIWQVTCVSIAAQLATFSLGLLYFHQFPVYFLFSNLIVIPISTLVLLNGILLLAVSSFSLVGSAIGSCLEWTIKVLNGSVLWVEGLPYSLINNVYIATFQSWLLLGIIIFITLLIVHKNYTFLLFAFSCALAFALFQWKHFYEDVKQDQFVVYQIPNHTAFEFMSNGNSYFFADSLLINDKDKIHFHINSNRTLAGITNIEINSVLNEKMKGFNFYVWKNKTFLWLRSKKAILPTNLKADYTIVSNDAYNLIPNMNTKELGVIILDGSSQSKASNNSPKISSIYSTKVSNAFIKRL